MNKIKSILLFILTNTIGRLLVAIQPKKAIKLKTEGLTLALSKDLSFSERLIRRVILDELEKHGNTRDLEQLHMNYWKNKGAAFFSDTEAMFEKKFLTECAFIFDIFEAQLKKEHRKLSTLVEIGTGNGKVLCYLSKKFSQIEHFVGIDLSKEQIEQNTNTFKNNTKLEFVAADAYDWVKARGTSNTVFVTSRGVLEYFVEQRLNEFLKVINALSNCAFIAIEPNGINHDFKKQPNSIIYGYERSFSHNYIKLFKDAGFRLWHHSIKGGDDDYSIQTFIVAANS